MARSSERGQMLLVVVLTMIVALTVGLSVVSRTITNLRISRQNDESQRAFQAAEAGVERALQSGATQFSLDLSNNAAYTTTATPLSGTSLLLNGEDRVDQASGIDVWLSDYSEIASELFNNKINGTITIHWSTTDQSCATQTGAGVAAALEVVTLTGLNSKDPTFKKYLYDPCGRISGQLNTYVAGTPINNVSFNYKASIVITDGIIAKVIPIFNSTKIGISSTVALPDQGTIIESTGESGETVRKVKYFSSHPQIPLEIFPYSILSQ